MALIINQVPVAVVAVLLSVATKPENVAFRIWFSAEHRTQEREHVAPAIRFSQGY